MGIDIKAKMVLIILIIVGVIVVFNIVGASAPALIDSANSISGFSEPNGTNNVSPSGLPLASLFASDGVVLLIFMAAVLIGMVIFAIKTGMVKK